MINYDHFIVISSYILKTTPLNTKLGELCRDYTGKSCHIIGIEGRDFTDIHKLCILCVFETSFYLQFL